MSTGTTNYPGSLDSQSGANPFAFGYIPILKQTALSAAVSDSATTLNVPDTTGFETRGVLALGTGNADTEHVTYTGKTATTFTGVTRAFGGTARAHAAGALVVAIIPPQTINAHGAALVASETKLGISESSAADTPVANTVLQSLTNGKSKWASIITEMIAANAATQSGVATTGGADSTTSATFVDMANLSVALTTVGGNVLVWMVGSATHSLAGTNVQLGFQVDAVSTVSGPAQHSAATVGEAKDFSNIHLFTGLSAGAHTFKARWLTSGGTVSAYGGRTMIAVELRR